MARIPLWVNCAVIYQRLLPAAIQYPEERFPIYRAMQRKDSIHEQSKRSNSLKDRHRFSDATGMARRNWKRPGRK
jgi:hypothetical protein